jgi:hypothetical protein
MECMANMYSSDFLCLTLSTYYAEEERILLEQEDLLAEMLILEFVCSIFLFLFLFNNVFASMGLIPIWDF